MVQKHNVEMRVLLKNCIFPQVRNTFLYNHMSNNPCFEIGLPSLQKGPIATEIGAKKELIPDRTACSDRCVNVCLPVQGVCVCVVFFCVCVNASVWCVSMFKFS